MTEEELDALLEGFAAELVPVVQDQLDRVAEQFADEVDGATELVAAAYSVSRIRELWNRRIPRIMTSLRSVFRRSIRVTAQDLDAPAPDGTELDDFVAEYTAAVEPLLRTVGDSLARAAQNTLADGVNAGESLDQLKARLLAAFSDTGSQLGPVRADRIAQTEAVRAFNAGVQAAAVSAEGPDRPLVKQWLTRNDAKVREAHRDVNGQLRLLGDPFDVGGFEMMYPGDPAAPTDLTVNCRCVMVATAPPQPIEGDDVSASLAAAATEHTGAMVALVPSAESAARLAAYASEPEDQLHLTLFYLGEADQYDDAARARVVEAMGRSAEWLSPVNARAFGVAQWNPDTDGPCWVWNIGDDHSHVADTGQRLHDAHLEVRFALEDRDGECPDMPDQYTPWAPHVAIGYGDIGDPSDFAAGCGPVVFDRLRVGFAGEYTDFPLTRDPEREPMDDPIEPDEYEAVPETPAVVTWSTPGGTALAFENQQTGDGRVFAPGALYWDGDGPWPLMANDNFDSHDDASLAGAIHTMTREGDRLAASGVLYLGRDAGFDAALLLAQGAPLGVSVDLDDVDVEMIDATAGGQLTHRGKMLRASVLPSPDGGYFLRGEAASSMKASATATVTETVKVLFTVGPDGTVPRSAFELEAAAGDPDATDGTILDTQRTGDYLMRITRGRVRGATLVNIPAFAGARITLDDPALFASAADIEQVAELVASGELSAATWAERRHTGPQTDTDYARVLRHVRRSKAPVGPGRVAQYLKIPVAAAQRLLAQAASKGEVVKLTRGLYTDATTSAKADHVMDDDRLSAALRDRLSASAVLVASVTGAVDLPVAGRDVEWEGDAATQRVFEWADGDPDKIGRGYAWRDDDADPTTKAAYKLGYADVIDGVLTIIPRGVFAAEAAVNGARGGVDISADELPAVREHLAAVRAHVDEETGSENMDGIQASAWAAMADLPPMPAAWFREPTVEELPPGGPGVNYSNGRIFGWVAQTGVQHAGYAKRIVIEDLGRIDTTNFLRQRRTLDDGSIVKVGAFTMNAGHHRDGAECETAACQFDDTRTVAGIITVGMNERGMWFSGAAAPWLSEWDRQVFDACQPSYHLKQANGRWNLHAVLSVPVPGHPSALLASAVTERSQLALTAAATMAEVEQVVETEKRRQAAAEVTAIDQSIDYDRLADSLVAAMARAEDRRAAEAAELAELLAEARTMVIGTTDTEGA